MFEHPYTMTKLRIAVLASGSGSNAENIYSYFEESNDVEISLILSNNKTAYVLDRAKRLGIPSETFDKVDFKESNYVVNLLNRHKIDLVVLAGFLWLVPENLINAFPDRILNIHPALLPKYGGKGMYGDRVHQAVKEGNETETGITIHYVNKNYDEGAIIAQYQTILTPQDTPSTIAEKVHNLEYEHFPSEIEKIALGLRTKKV